MKSSFGEKRVIETIYLGGGTPSLMKIEDINALLNQISACYFLDNDLEVTIEANPDDLSSDYLSNLYNYTDINRLSIGVQSFEKEDLVFMNRAHTAKQSYLCLENALKAGFDNISADLIFACQTTSNSTWQRNLSTMTDYNIPHLSIYGLSIEEKTALHHFVKTGKSKPIDHEKFESQFVMTQHFLDSMDYEQYEVSNYAKKNCRSKHNANYWNKIDYLGIGPSAHSYYYNRRYWNVSNNSKYIKGIRSNSTIITEEVLTETDDYNEMLLTRLRCIEGISKEQIANLNKKYQFYFLATVEKLLTDTKVIFANDSFYIPQKYRIFTDQITQELFYIESQNE